MIIYLEYYMVALLCNPHVSRLWLVLFNQQILIGQKIIGLERCAEDKKICPIRRYEITGNSEIGRTGAPEKARNDRARGKVSIQCRGLEGIFFTKSILGVSII